MLEEQAALRKERIEYAKACFDRFVEVCKARIAVGTTLAIAIVTLTGVGLQSKRPELLYIAACIPLGISLLIDTLLKNRYAAPFLYLALRIEHEVYGKDSAGLHFLRVPVADENLVFSWFEDEDDQRSAYLAFKNRYTFRGLQTKLPVLVLVTAAEVTLANLV